MPDNDFVLQAANAIRELQRIVLDNPVKANHRYAQLAEDVQGIMKRFLTGSHCRCGKYAPLSSIQHRVFCGDDCRRLDEDKESLTEQRIREAIADHIGPEVPTL